MSVDAQNNKLIQVIVSTIIKECGFEKVQEVCLEVLSEIYAAFLKEVVMSTKAYAELGGRTQPLVTDVVMAFTELGFDHSGLQKPSQVSPSLSLTRLLKTQSVSVCKELKVGETRTLNHASSHLPPLPDPHTYIRTYAPINPLTDYLELRKKISSQKENTEKGLTRFIAMTGVTENLFAEDPYAYPLIASKLPSLTDNVIQREDEEEDDGGRGNGDDGEDEIPIDNPYLNPIIMPEVS